VPIRAVVGFGANLGDRLATMRAALGRLARVARVDKTSRVYVTAPLGGPEQQPEFLNAAALVVYDGTPEALLEALLGIERELGRIRAAKWGPRSIDLDVLWIEGVALRTAHLIVPHPSLKERAFALVPLLEVVPDARHPPGGESYTVPAGDVRATADFL